MRLHHDPFDRQLVDAFNSLFQSGTRLDNECGFRRRKQLRLMTQARKGVHLARCRGVTASAAHSQQQLPSGWQRSQAVQGLACGLARPLDQTGVQAEMTRERYRPAGRISQSLGDVALCMSGSEQNGLSRNQRPTRTLGKSAPGVGNGRFGQFQETRFNGDMRTSFGKKLGELQEFAAPAQIPSSVPDEQHADRWTDRITSQTVGGCGTFRHDSGTHVGLGNVRPEHVPDCRQKRMLWRAQPAQQPPGSHALFGQALRDALTLARTILAFSDRSRGLVRKICLALEC